jgi:putative ABC transport system substrate-binding protein
MSAQAGRRAFVLGAGALLAPCHALAQLARRTYVVAYWENADPPDPKRPRLRWLEERLAAHGFEVGGNTRIAYLFTPGISGDFAPHARQLLTHGPQVVWRRGAWGFGRGVQAIQAAARSVPIVFDCVIEEAAVRLVGGDRRRPSTHATGVALAYAEFAEKRLELVRQMLPKARRVAVVGDFGALATYVPSSVAKLDDAARKLDLEILRGDVASYGGGQAATEEAGNAALRAVLNDLAKQRPDALMAYAGFNASRRGRQFLDFETRNRVPLIDDGGTYRSVVGFGIDWEDHDRRALAILMKILKGATPAEIPVEVTSRFLLAVNVARARQIGVSIPPEVLLRADLVVRP